MIYALDTNIISYILGGNVGIDAKLTAAVTSGIKVIIPLMVYYEVRRGLLANNATNKMRVFNKLCARLNIHSLTVTDMNTAASIYAKRKIHGMPIDDADLLIAAQCVTNGYTLVTNNVKHFNGINDLQLVNWVE